MKTVLRDGKIAGHHACPSLLIETLALSQGQLKNIFVKMAVRLNFSFSIFIYFSASWQCLSGFHLASREVREVSHFHLVGTLL